MKLITINGYNFLVILSFLLDTDYYIENDRIRYSNGVKKGLRYVIISVINGPNLDLNNVPLECRI